MQQLLLPMETVGDSEFVKEYSYLWPVDYKSVNKLMHPMASAKERRDELLSLAQNVKKPHQKLQKAEAERNLLKLPI